MSSITNYKTFSLSHVENISSDEAQLVDDTGISFESNKYARSHRTSKKEKRQSRRKARSIENEKEKERCLAHGKRRCIEHECYPIEVTITRKKRARQKYNDRKVVRTKYSSESEDELLRNREELKMALNIIEPSNRTVNSSTLSHKLSAIQSNHLDKPATKHRKRKTSRSPERQRRPRSDENSSKRSKAERDRSDSRSKIASPIIVHDKNDNDIQDEAIDEAISLEEQELRLIALKSAVLKKHEARKRKQLANQIVEQIVRPYSPTDSVVFVADETGDRSNDSDNNNMDISPISSPGNQYQPMDMDLASSNENSKSPIFSYDKPQTFPYEPFIDWGTVHIPVAINSSYVDMNQATKMAAAAANAVTINQPFATQPSFPMIFNTTQKESIFTEKSILTPSSIQSGANDNNHVHIDNEDELRAQLIEQMRSTNTFSSNSATESTKTENLKKNNSHIDSFDSLEEDCLRSLLLSTKGKKSNVTKESTSDLQTPTGTPEIGQKSVDGTKCDDMPKLASNLREALRRLKNNQQNKLPATTVTAATSAAVSSPSSTALKVESTKLSAECVQIESKQNDSLQASDQNERIKTVVNNRLDGNENELSNLEGTATAVLTTEMVGVPLKKAERIPTMKLDTIERVLELTEAKKATAETDVKTVNENDLVKPFSKAFSDDASADKASSKIQVGKSSAAAESKPEVVAIPKIAERPQSITSAGTKATAAIATATNLKKMELIRKSTSSPVITTWTAKPVKKLIISLNEDSSTDNDDMDCDENVKNKKTDVYSVGSQSNDSNNTFQLRLDQFLQSVRANTDAIQESKQVPKQTTPKIANKSTENNGNSATRMKVPVEYSCSVSCRRNF